MDGLPSRLEIPLWQIARAGTAAPFYFAPPKLKLEKWRVVFISGYKALGKIKAKFNQWMGDGHKELEACAHNLVYSRRTRATDRDRWEHFAGGAVFHCLGFPRLELEGCLAEFRNRANFRSHLLHHHGLAQRG